MQHYGIKNTRLAEIYECHPDYVSKIRCGKKSPPLKKFWRLLYSMEIVCPGSLVYYCRVLCGREEEFLVEDVIATLDPEEIVYYLLPESLPEFRAAVDERMKSLPSLRFNYIKQAPDHELPKITNELVECLKTHRRLHLLTEAIGDEDLAEFMVLVARRIARRERQKN